MKRKYKIVICIFFLVISIVGVYKFKKIDDVSASYIHNFEEYEEISVGSDGEKKILVRIVTYVELSQNSSFNYVEGNFNTTGMRLISWSFKNRFKEDYFMRDDSKISYGVISNERFSSSESSKVEYAEFVFEVTDNSNYNLSFKPSAPKLVPTNLVNLELSSVTSIDDGEFINKVNLGDEFYYKITLTNVSYTATDEVNVEFSFPNEILVLDAPGGDIQSNKVIWNISSIRKNEQKYLYVKAKLDNRISENVKSTITEVKSDINGNILRNNNILNIKYPNLLVSASLNKEDIKPNEEFEYTISLENNGEGVAKEVVLENIINENLIMLETSENNIGTDSNLKFIFDEVLPKETKTILVKAKAKENSELGLINNKLIVYYNDQIMEDSFEINIKDSNLIINTSTSKNKIKPNEEFEYILNIENNGDINSNEIVVENNVDSNLEIISVSDNGNINGQTITWNLNSLGASQEKNLSIKVKLKNDVTAGSNINNVVYLTEKNKKTISDNNTVVTIDSNVVVTSNVDKTEFIPGETFKYKITLENNGDASSNNLIVENIIDSNLTIISVSDNGNINGQTITWNEFALNPNEIKEYEVEVKVNYDTVDNTKITNIITVKEQLKSDKNSEINVLIKKPVLNIINTIISTGGNDINFGEEFFYEISVINDGEISSGNYTVKDVVDEHLTILDSDGGIIEGNTITWKGNNIEPKEVIKYTIKVKSSVKPEPFVSILNTAIVNYLNEENKQTLSHSITNFDVTLNCESSKDNLKIGDEYYYKLHISNSGNSSIDDLIVKNNLSSNLELVNVVYDSDLLKFNNDNNNLTFTFNSLIPDESLDILIYVKVIDNKDDVIKNTGSISYKNKNYDFNNVVNMAKPIIVVNNTTSKDKVLNNEHFYYTLNISNIGNAKSDKLKVISSFDKNLVIVSCQNCVKNDNELEWDLDPLKENESTEIVIEAYASDLKNGYVINNDVTIKENNVILSESNKTITFVEPKITVEKSISDTVIKVGQSFTYYIKIKNDSDVVLENVLVKDVIDNALKLEDIGNATLNGNFLEWNVTILPNEEIILKVVATPTIEKNITSDVLVSFNDKEFKSNKVNITISNEEVENPKTGDRVRLIYLGVGIVLLIIIGLFKKKKKVFYKI